MRKLLIIVLVLISVISKGQGVLERTVKATEQLETGANFVYRTYDIPVLDITYHEFSSDNINWRKNYVNGDCYVRFSNTVTNTQAKHSDWWVYNICNQTSAGLDTIIVNYGSGQTQTLTAGDYTINMTIPGTVSGTSTNSQTTTSHTHQLQIRLNDNLDVNASPTDGQVLKWNAVSSQWEAKNDLLLSGTGGGLKVREQDGNPNVSNVTEIRVPNAHLVNNGSGSVSLVLTVEPTYGRNDYWRAGTVTSTVGTNTITFNTPLPKDDYIVTSSYVTLSDGSRQILNYGNTTVNGFNVYSVLEPNRLIKYTVIRDVDSLLTAIERSGNVFGSNGIKVNSDISGENIYIDTTYYNNWNVAYADRVATLTTNGNSGVATLSGNTLNIPNYGTNTSTIQAPTLSGNLLGLTQTNTTVSLSYLTNKFNGCISIPTLTDNNNGTVLLGTTTVNLSSNVDGSGSIATYSLTGGTFTLTNLVQNYIVANYNSGTPQVQLITDVTLINETTIVPIYSIFRNGNLLHIQNWDALGLALANKVHQSIVKTQRYRRDETIGGLTISESGIRNLTISAGRVWVGAVPMDLTSVATSTDNLILWYHSGGTWASTLLTQYPNTWYDNGTNTATLTANRYAVCWLYRGVESNKHLYTVLGDGDYTLTDAQTASIPALPVAISSHAILVAKLIVQNGSNTAYSIQSAFGVPFSGGGGVSSHADLSNLAWTTSGHTGTANTLAIFGSGGTASTTANNTINWDAAYNKRLTAASLSASTMTLTLADASTVTATIPQWNQSTSGTASSVTNSHVLKFDTGVTEGTDLYTYNGSTAKTIDIKAGTNITLTKSAGSITIASTATGGSSSATIWSSLTGAYATATTFTFSGTDTDAKMVELSLLTCTSSDGNTRRIGYIKTATNNSGTITCNVVTDSDLASGDKDFKVAYNRKVTDYMRLVTIPGECIADASYSQGMFYSDIQTASYLLPVDASVITAAAGTGAALTWNVYKGATNLFSSAPDMTTNTVLRSQRPNTNTISAADNVSLRILSSAGATNKAADFQAKLYIVPQSIFTAFGMNWILIIGLVLIFLGGSLVEIRINKKIVAILIIFCSLQGFGQIKAYYRFNGNSNDASGNSLNGTDTGITYSQANGKLNQGAGFNGSSSVITVAHNSVLNLEAGDCTIIFWLYMNALPTSTNRFFICGKGYYAVGVSEWVVHIMNTGKIRIEFEYNQESVYDGYLSTTALTIQKWHHVAVVYKKSSRIIEVWINGIKDVASMLNTVNPVNTVANTKTMTIGKANPDNVWYLNGKLDNLLLDNSAFSPAQLKNNLSAAKGLFQN